MTVWRSAIAMGSFVALAFLLVARPSLGEAQPAARVGVPFAEHVRSLEVLDPGTPMYVAPNVRAARRGTLAWGTRIPRGQRVLANGGCSSRAWVRYREFYVCERHLRPSSRAPYALPRPHVPDGATLPHTYAFTRFDAVPLFERPSHYFRSHYETTLGEGFGIVIEERRVVRGVPFVRTRTGGWLTEESIGYARGSEFAGVRIAAGDALDLAWVRPRGGANLVERPGGRRLRRLGHRQLLHIVGRQRSYLEVEGGGFVRRRDVNLAERTDPPAGVSATERWIDVSIAEQVLVAYIGSDPVFATLVSTGRPGRATATPRGVHRIWVKLAFSDMDDLERDDVVSYYAIERVPWVQYFEGSNGLHAAFWHDDFGRARSHGCVNLSPRDAAYVFQFTRPVLPDGWEAVLPHDGSPGAIVRVR